MGARTSEVDTIHEVAELLLADRSPRDRLEILSPRAVAMVEMAQLVRGCHTVPPRSLFILTLLRNILEWSSMDAEHESVG